MTTLKKDLKMLIKYSERLCDDLMRECCEDVESASEAEIKILVAGVVASTFDDILIRLKICKEDFIDIWKIIPLDADPKDYDFMAGLDGLKEGEKNVD